MKKKLVIVEKEEDKKEKKPGFRGDLRKHLRESEMQVVLVPLGLGNNNALLIIIRLCELTNLNLMS